MDLLLRIQAPERPANLEVPYVPKRLALVVDRSGSMSGEPLDEALKCVQHIATHLTSRDELSIVVYDTKVDVLMPLGPVVSQSAIQSAIRHVLSGGSTNLHGGWLEGARQLESGIDNSISRVILLSDGRLNAGLRDELKIQEQCSAWQTKGVTTTTVGLGRGFNEDLMVGMAQAGGGQNYYGQQAEDLFDNFDEELSLLQAMYMQKLSVKLIPAPGVIIEMLSMTKPDAAGAYPLSDLAWDAESWLAVRLHLSPCAPGTSRELLALTLTGQGVDWKTVRNVCGPISTGSTC
jgi:Ca-activated chloride channel family protein